MVGPPAPVLGRPQVVSVPGRAFEPSAIPREHRQFELATLRDEKAIQVRRVNFVVDRPFLHRGGIAGNRELEEDRFLPDFDRFHKRSRAEHTVSFSADPGPLDLGANGIGDPGAKEQLLRRWQFGKRNHVLPDRFRRCLNVDRGRDGKDGHRLRQSVFRDHQQHREQRHREER